MAFGKSLKELRLKRRLSPDEFGKAAKCTRAWVHHLESRYEPPESLMRHKAMATALGISLDQFAALGAENSQPKTGAAA